MSAQRENRQAEDREFVGFVSEDGKKLTIDFLPAFKSYYARFKGEEVVVIVRKKREKRSARQNRGYHAMVAPWARDEGHNVDELKRDLLREIFGTHETVSLVTGEVTEALNEPHTSTLSVQQFSELIERTMEIAAGCGYVLVAPDEYRKAKEAAARKAAKQQQRAA